jgi:3-hydroxyisobutyrate dehydrogenase-like beta-hydroxyacid dehydrogenase
MARNLLSAGFKVVAHDLQADRLQSIVDAGATAAEDATDVANQADLVMVCLDKVEAMHAVAKACARGSAIQTYVDLSTSGPSVALAVREYFTGTAINMLDAPISGHIHRAVDGTLTVMVSGPQPAFEYAKPAFDAIGANVFFIGDIPGGGQMMKVANNYVNNVQAVGTGEAIAMGVKFGLDPAIMFDVMNVSTGRNNQTEGQMKDAVLGNDYSLGAVITISRKDMAVAMHEAGRLGVPATTGAAAQAAFEGAIEMGGDRQRSSAVYKYIAAQAGVDVD